MQHAPLDCSTPEATHPWVPCPILPLYCLFPCWFVASSLWMLRKPRRLPSSAIFLVAEFMAGQILPVLEAVLSQSTYTSPSISVGPA